MLGFITEYYSSILIGAAVLIILVLIVVKMIRGGASGTCSCGSCSSCSCSDICSANKDAKKDEASSEKKRTEDSD